MLNREGGRDEGESTWREEGMSGFSYIHLAASFCLSLFNGCVHVLSVPCVCACVFRVTAGGKGSDCAVYC